MHASHDREERIERRCCTVTQQHHTDIVCFLYNCRNHSHTVSLFRRAVLNANEGYLVIQNKDAPKGYSDALEPYE